MASSICPAISDALARRAINRVTEQNEHVIPEMPGNEPAVAAGCLRDATLKVRHRLAQVFKAHAVGSLHHADQFAGRSDDLATLGFTMLGRRGFSRGADCR
jgi:hypothetical protein